MKIATARNARLIAKTKTMVIRSSQSSIATTTTRMAAINRKRDEPLGRHRLDKLNIHGAMRESASPILLGRSLGELSFRQTAHFDILCTPEGKLSRGRRRTVG
jgi:hypothetical protein